MPSARQSIPGIFIAYMAHVTTAEVVRRDQDGRPMEEDRNYVP
jgi:hypothetical protein